MEYVLPQAFRTPRTQLKLIALAYAAVFAFAAILLYQRRRLELQYPVEASGGMWAAGDLLLQLFIACLFMVPTIFLIWVIAHYEHVYSIYSQCLLGLSLTAPICLGIFLLGLNEVPDSLGYLSLYRAVGSPFILVGMGISRLLARSKRAKCLVSYALLIETLTIAAGIALFIYASATNRN